MDSNAPPKARQSLFEYFLYFAVILETGLAAFFYKLAFQDRGLASLKTYFGVLYFVFLAWAISQLNRLHRRRRLLEPGPTIETEPEPIADISAVQMEPLPSQSNQRARPVLGLTAAQLAIVVLVFGTAVATFSWAFSVFRAGR